MTKLENKLTFFKCFSQRDRSKQHKEMQTFCDENYIFWRVSEQFLPKKQRILVITNI